jgi:small subunit ribosomal protein S8
MKLFCNLTSKLNISIQSSQSYIVLPKNLFFLNFLKLLFLEGFISRIVVMDSKKIKVYLKYCSKGMSSFKKIKFLSTPGKIRYTTYKELAKLSTGVGLIIVSTNRGLLTHHSCIKLKTGGTALCYII